VGVFYQEAQLFKFLSGRLVTQHIKAERSAGRADATPESPCSLCRAGVVADNDHMLFGCSHPEMIAARAQWILKVQRAWKKAPSLPGTFKRAALRLWSISPDGRMKNFSERPPSALQAAIGPPAQLAEEEDDDDEYDALFRQMEEEELDAEVEKAWNTVFQDEEDQARRK